MHQYLKAIGFSKVNTKQEVRDIIKDIIEHHDAISMVSCDGIQFQEYVSYYVYKLEAEIGIACCGTEEEERFEQEYYFPFFKGSGITTVSDVMVEKKMDQNAYLGICDDFRIEISIIFQLQNAAEYLRQKADNKLKEEYVSVTLSGLALSGTILLPIAKNPEAVQFQKEESHNRMMLLSAAREGNQQAIESLTLDDIDTYSQVSQRLNHEDVFSIVDSYFMPHGLECTLYSIMGEILHIQKVKNQATEELLYILTLDVNELQFDVCVPAEKLIGEPARGRRFKGNILLQGWINFG